MGATGAAGGGDLGGGSGAALRLRRSDRARARALGVRHMGRAPRSTLVAGGPRRVAVIVGARSPGSHHPGRPPRPTSRAGGPGRQGESRPPRRSSSHRTRSAASPSQDLDHTGGATATSSNVFLPLRPAARDHQHGRHAAPRPPASPARNRDRQINAITVPRERFDEFANRFATSIDPPQRRPRRLPRAHPSGGRPPGGSPPRIAAGHTQRSARPSPRPASGSGFDVLQADSSRRLALGQALSRRPRATAVAVVAHDAERRHLGHARRSPTANALGPDQSETERPAGGG